MATDTLRNLSTRGQVGTAVEQLDDKTWLVEFSDDDDRGSRRSKWHSLAQLPRSICRSVLLKNTAQSRKKSV